MTRWNLGMAEVGFFHRKNCCKAGGSTIFRKADWWCNLFLARNCFAQHRFHQCGSGSRIQTTYAAILKLFGA